MADDLGDDWWNGDTAGDENEHDKGENLSEKQISLKGKLKLKFFSPFHGLVRS